MSGVSATPLFFGPLERRLFGWLHRPSTDSHARMGVVLCSPIGQESLNAHRSVRHLADTLASAGLTTLRFDYDGCGNSAGDDRDADRLVAWIDSVRAAIEAIKLEADVDRVLLVGLRFGATLATLAAASRTDLAGVVAIAPVTSGRGLVREWKTIGLVRGWRRRDGVDGSSGAAAATADGSIEVAGYVMTAQTCESVGKISLLEVAPLVCPVLVIDRDDVSGSERWLEKLTAAAVRVERVVLPGFLAMMRDPAYAQVPIDMVHAVVAWARQCVDEIPAAGERQSPPRDPSAIAPSQSAVFACAVEGQPSVVETLLIRHDDGVQFGILSEPLRPPGSPADAAPALMLVNSGAVHLVGPNRLYVTLARHFASLGFVVLRVDLSGLGDSDAHQGEPQVAPYTRLGLRDIERWLVHLKNLRLVKACDLLGICSGGFHAFRSALVGLPFAKVLSLNPVNFYWTEGMQLDVPIHDHKHEVVRLAAGYRRSVLDPQKWRRLLVGDVDVRLAARVVGRRISSRARLIGQKLARLFRVRLKNDLTEDVKLASSRETRLELIFSEGDPGLSILTEQAGSMVEKLRRAGRLVVMEVPGADHTFSSESSRNDLKAMLTQRLLVRDENPGGSA